MSKHPSWGYIIEQASDDTLNDLMGLCDVDPGEPDLCMACYAYHVLTKREEGERCDHNFFHPGDSEYVKWGAHRLCRLCGQIKEFT